MQLNGFKNKDFWKGVSLLSLTFGFDVKLWRSNLMLKS